MSKTNFRKLQTDIAAIHARLAEHHAISKDDLEWLRSQRETADPPAPKVEPVEDDVTALLKRVRFDLAHPPTQPKPLFSLAGQVIATPENLMVVQAKMKAGKSAAISGMLASTMNPTGDCLWFASSNTDGKAVLHFDTEQSSWQHHHLIVRSFQRAGKVQSPPWFYSYHVKGYSVGRTKEMIFAGIEAAAKECGGVHSVVIDGIADICADVNDAAEANALVAEMEAIAMRHQTLVVCVLHENHASDSGKTRGHLGSQLARKAETNLRLEKDKDGVTIMYADTSRSVHITKKGAPGFRWDDEARMHVAASCSIASGQAEKAKEEMRMLAGMIFANASDGLTWRELREQIMVVASISSATAERAIRKMTDFFIITKTGERYKCA